MARKTLLIDVADERAGELISVIPDVIRALTGVNFVEWGDEAPHVAAPARVSPEPQARHGSSGEPGMEELCLSPLIRQRFDALRDGGSVDTFVNALLHAFIDDRLAGMHTGETVEFSSIRVKRETGDAGVRYGVWRIVDEPEASWNESTTLDLVLTRLLMLIDARSKGVE